MKILLLVTLFGQVLLATDPPSFDYDKNAPLNAEEHEVTVRDGIRVSLFSYANAKVGRAEGMLVVPLSIKGKTGGIIHN